MESESSRITSLIRYGAVAVAASCAAVYLYKTLSSSSENLHRRSTIRPVQTKGGEWEEASGILRLLLSDCEYQHGDQEAKTVFITLKGCRLDIYQAHKEVAKREMFDEEPPELTFKGRSTFSIYKSEVLLLPEDLSQKHKWLMKHPIAINLKAGSFKGENHYDNAFATEDSLQNQKQLILFARSNRDKEAWTRWLKLAAEKKDFIENDPDPIMSIIAGRPLAEPVPVYIDRKTKSVWLNGMIERTVNDAKVKTLITSMLTKQVEELLGSMPWQNQFDSIMQTSLEKVDISGMSTPRVTGVAPRYENEYGLWEEMCVKFDGAIKVTVKVKLNFQELDDNGPETFWMERLHNLTQYSFVKRVLENTTIYIVISLESLKGVLAMNIPHPPADMAWVGFRSGTKVSLTGSVYWGTWSMPFFHKIIDSLKEYMLQSFYKHLVIPNMVQVQLPACFNKM